MGDSVIQFVTVLIIFALVLAVTYFTTRWIANFQKTGTTGKNVEVLEVHRISNNKYIQIVRIGNEYISIAVCKDSVTLLSKMSEEDLNLTKGTSRNDTESFQQVFERFNKNKKKNK